MTNNEDASKKKLSARAWTMLFAGVAFILGATVSGLVVFQLQQTQIADIVAESLGEIKEADAEADERVAAMKTATDLREDRLDSREAELNGLELSLSTRETAVTGAEIQKAESEFQSGMHTVGVSVGAGTYTANVTSGMCYYKWMDGTGSTANIVDNNIVKSGLATVTLSDGEFFESSGCGTWVKQ